MTFLEQLHAMPAEDFDRLEAVLYATTERLRRAASCPEDVDEPCGDRECLTCWCRDCSRPSERCVCP